MNGIFIGSFNPPTKAHLEICLQLKNQFSKIVLVPVNSNDKNLININDRIKMLNILKSKYSFLEISMIMKKYANVNYRIIDLLSKEYGNINLIMGSDLLEKFTTFDNYEYLLDNYSYTIIARNKTDVDKLIRDKFKKYEKKFMIVNYDSDISSSLIRRKIQEKKDIKGLLDSDVLLFIQKNHLY